MSRHKASSILHLALMAFCVIATGLFFVERQQAQEEASQFRLAVKGAGAGQWYWDIEANELRWDEQMFVLLGCGKDGWKEHSEGVYTWQGTKSEAPAQAFQAVVLDEDRAPTMAILQRAVMEHAAYQSIFRTVNQVGKVTTIRAGGQVYGGGRFMTGLCIKAQPDDTLDNTASAWGVVTEPQHGG